MEGRKLQQYSYIDCINNYGQMGHMYLLILVGSWILISLGQVVRLGYKVSKLEVWSFVAITIITQSDNQLIF